MERDDPIDIVDLYKAVIEACDGEVLSKCDLYLEQPELVSPKPREKNISVFSKIQLEVYCQCWVLIG